jgi:hypothetical protein
MPKPPTAKAVHIIFAIGPDDESTIDQFVEGIKLAVSHAYMGKVLATMLYGEYQHDGKRYKQLDWERWDGDPSKKPQDRYTNEPRAVAIHQTVRDKPLTSADVKKALDVHREALGLPPRPLPPEAHDRPVESLSGPLAGWPRLEGWEPDPWPRVSHKKRLIRRNK